MKRLYAAIGLLLAVAAFCAFNVSYVNRISGDMIGLLEQAEALAGEEKWDEAQRQCLRASEYWQEKNVYLSLALNSAELEPVELGLPSLEASSVLGQVDEFVITSAQLKAQLEHIAAMESPSLGSLL